MSFSVELRFKSVIYRVAVVSFQCLVRHGGTFRRDQQCFCDDKYPIKFVAKVKVTGPKRALKTIDNVN